MSVSFSFSYRVDKRRAARWLLAGSIAFASAFAWGTAARVAAGLLFPYNLLAYFSCLAGWGGTAAFGWLTLSERLGLKEAPRP